MRHITFQQADGNFATFDTETETERIEDFRTNNEILGEWPVTIAQREVIDMRGATLEVLDGELIINPPEEDPLLPVFDADRERAEQEAREYSEWLLTPAGRTAQRYIYYMQHGKFYEDNE